MQIYIHRDGQQFGPYSVEQARDYLASGNLLPGDLAWHEGAADWMPLDQVAEVATNPSPSPEPPPPQVVQNAWIPPRRNAAPSGVAAKPAQAPQNALSRNVTVEPRKVSPSAAPAKAQGTVRRSSPDVNDYKRRQRAIGARNMTIGAIICAVGTAITFFSYEAAATSPGGGSYLIAGGAIIFGGIRFVQGIVQFFNA